MCLCLHRSGLIFPPWGSTRMENTSWPSWKNTIWRMVLTWVPSAALQMASCKQTPPPPPPDPDIVWNLFHPSPSQSSRLPGLPHVPIWPQRRFCAHCPLNPPRSGRRVFFSQPWRFVFPPSIVPLPPFDPSPFKLGEDGNRGQEWREGTRSAPSRICLFSLFLMSSEIILCFCYCWTHSPSWPQPNSSYYKMNKYLIFFLTPQNYRWKDTPSSNQQTDHLAWENRFSGLASINITCILGVDLCIYIYINIYIKLCSFSGFWCWICIYNVS